MKPTEEQQEIISAFNADKRNIIVSARAGAAKTTTLRMLIEEHAGNSLYLAFNKAVVTEARTKVPQRCRVMTLNGIGHQTFARNSGNKPDLQRSKNYDILREKGYKGVKFSEILRAVRLSKQHGFVPELKASLITEQEYFRRLDMKFEDAERALICEVIRGSWDLADEKGIIDFDDQILIPTLKRMPFFHAPVVFVDEAQDLSEINRRMIKLIAGIGTRLVAVGDEAQAIYGFRGAVPDSMNKLQEEFKMDPYKLTMTFRCSKAVTAHANWRTGDMRHAPDALDGSVAKYETIAFEDIGARTAILCRNNAPLLNLALRMMKGGLAPRLLGRDVLDETIKSLESITKKHMPVAEALDSVEHWAEEKKRVWKSALLVEDKAECMRIFLRDAKNAGEAIARIRALQHSPEGTITLSTIHKAKGAEYQDVIIVDRHLLGVGLDDQEDNLLYVAQTRARDTLRYVTSAMVQRDVETNVADAQKSG